MATSKTPSRPRIVVLDGHTLNPGDLSWAKLRAMGQVNIYDHSTPKEIPERAGSADIILVNKAIIDKEQLERLPSLKCICVTASGYNNIDVERAAERQIPVCNAVGYGTDSVAQHVFALLLELTNRVRAHHETVLEGEWGRSRDFCYTLGAIPELSGKVMGIYGFGRIGQRVASIAQAFGMEVIATHKHPERDARPGVSFVPIDTLFEKSDVISLHAPLTPENRRVVNAGRLALMKRTAYLINTGRGGLIDEPALKLALRSAQLAGAALDVLSEEPPRAGSLLLDAPNCLITPHMAWATREARQRLLDITVENVKAFLRGEPRNVVD
ncbi:MAG: D-2-hydroxyacid dehydrogenase [Lewinellaceae bacterium]|nr:D-2-hydroxyacid dehydrogenase [Lewinellaceae bacterium]MCB9291255.1 D-2-hydroxyacid dehydrogenase [Lewinellaceae bacterium]